MAGLVPAIHVGKLPLFSPGQRIGSTWMAGTRPAMTKFAFNAGLTSALAWRTTHFPSVFHDLTRHGRACPGHPRRKAAAILAGTAYRFDVDGRDTPGHDEIFLL